MPKSTFLNLSKEKQKRILQAAEQEFLSVPYGQVSINMIIKKAGIPRGSFYQYFEDKEDLFVCAVHEHKKKLFDMLMQKVDEAKGDVFLCIERHIDTIIDMAYGDKNFELKMIFEEPRAFELLTRAITKEEICDEKIYDEFLNKVDITKLDVKDDRELLLLIDFLGMIVRDSIGRIFIHRYRRDEKQAKAILREQIDSLKRHYEK